MDGQAAVHQVRGQQPAEVVRRETGCPETGVLFGQFSAAAAEHDEHRRGRDHAGDRAGVALEQEWHGDAHSPFVVVVALNERNGAAMLGMPPDDRGDHGEQFRRHRDDALAVCLGRAITNRAMTSPLGRWYCLMLRWVSSSNSSMRLPAWPRNSAPNLPRNAQKPCTTVKA